MADAPDTSASGVGILKQKVAGIPVWVIGLAVGGGAAALLYFKNKSSAASAAQAQQGLAGTSAGNASSLYPIAPVTYVTGVQQPTPDTSSTTSSTSSQPSATIRQSQAGTSGNYAWWDNSHSGVGTTPQPGSNAVQGPEIPFGSPVTLTGQTENVGGNLWYQISTNAGNLWIVNHDLSLGAGGLGGMVHGRGGLGQGNPWTDFAQQYRAPHYWSGLGGKGGTLLEASHQTGVPVNRLASLNPFHDGGLARVA